MEATTINTQVFSVVQQAVAGLAGAIYLHWAAGREHSSPWCLSHSGAPASWLWGQWDPEQKTPVCWGCLEHPEKAEHLMGDTERHE